MEVMMKTEEPFILDTFRAFCNVQHFGRKETVSSFLCLRYASSGNMRSDYEMPPEQKKSSESSDSELQLAKR